MTIYGFSSYGSIYLGLVVNMDSVKFHFQTSRAGQRAPPPSLWANYLVAPLCALEALAVFYFRET